MSDLYLLYNSLLVEIFTFTAPPNYGAIKILKVDLETGNMSSVVLTVSPADGILDGPLTHRRFALRKEAGFLAIGLRVYEHLPRTCAS